jgi:hypothetical protein
MLRLEDEMVSYRKKNAQRFWGTLQELVVERSKREEVGD